MKFSLKEHCLGCAACEIWLFVAMTLLRNREGADAEGDRVLARFSCKCTLISDPEPVGIEPDLAVDGTLGKIVPEPGARNGVGSQAT